MWTILAEKPLIVSITLGIIVASLMYGWLQTGNKRVAIAALVFLLLIPGSYFLAASIETDREKILDMIHSTAAAVEKNDHESAVVVIADPQVRQRALQELPKYDFHRLTVRNIQIKMVSGSYPPEASVDLDASVAASMAQGGMNNVKIPRRVILTFQKQPDESWAVTDYTHRPLVGGPDAFSPNRL